MYNESNIFYQHILLFSNYVLVNMVTTRLFRDCYCMRIIKHCHLETSLRNDEYPSVEKHKRKLIYCSTVTKGLLYYESVLCSSSYKTCLVSHVYCVMLHVF